MTITKLEASWRTSGQWSVWLDNGAFLSVEEGDVVRLALYTGMEVSQTLWKALTEAAGRNAIHIKALELLSRRSMSRRELVKKLTARSRNREAAPAVSPELAEETADWLEALGYLNDALYAQTVAQHYSAKGYGQRKIQDEFFRRGVPREYWEEALAEASSPEEKIDAFLRRYFRGNVPDRRERKRACDALARRGYRWEEIQEGLHRYGIELEDEQV